MSHTRSAAIGSVLAVLLPSCGGGDPAAPGELGRVTQAAGSCGSASNAWCGTYDKDLANHVGNNATYHDPTTGCAPTTYEPGSGHSVTDNGDTYTVCWHPNWDVHCGRYQVDVRIDDPSGAYVNGVGVVLDWGVSCCGNAPCPYCGDGVCNSGESCGNCSQDCPPEPETCDGKDNDCSGQIDEGVTNTCTDFSTCNQYSSCGTCPATPAETCDGKDNDCNGQVDEGVTQTCIDFETCESHPSCDACPAAPAEICDGKDNDCDGQVDEDCPCQPGPGTLGKPCNCVPAPEICDGKDNDCDGKIDEVGCGDQGARVDGGAENPPDAGPCQGDCAKALQPPAGAHEPEPYGRCSFRAATPERASRLWLALLAGIGTLAACRRRRMRG